MPSATENNGKWSGMDEAHLSVPWYVSGKLEDEGARKLEELAREDQEFAKLIADARQESEAAASVNDALGRPSPDVWARLKKSIERERRVQSNVWPRERFRSLKAALSSMIAGLTAPQWQAVAVAALALCVIQAGAIVYLAGGASTPAKYRTASGQQTKTNPGHSAFIVSFSDGATIGDINKSLDAAGAVIVDGPGADMVYHLGLRNDNVEAKDRAYSTLQASGVVKLILPEK